MEFQSSIGGPNMGGANMTPSVLTQACENCRRRKVKCNRQDPCSNCLTSNLECRPAKRVIEHRPRVVLSSNYQKSIDEINRDKSAETPSFRSAGYSASSSDGMASGSVSTPAPPAFEGDSSFATQTVMAGELIAKQGQKSNEILDALSSLKDLMNTSSIDGFSNGFDDLYFDQDERPKSLPEMELLPAQFVISILRKLKEYPSVHYLAYAMRDQMALEKICQAVYFPTEPVSLGQLTTMHGLLLFLLEEYIALNDPILNGWDAAKFLSLCEKNLHIGCQSYEILAVPHVDNVKALTLGVIFAQLSSKPLLAWTLCSAAARHVFTLGYHRERSLKSDPPNVADEKRHLFWSLYGVDKNLSLTLGRASNFQDFDIDTEYFSVSKTEGIAPWDQASIAFISLGRLQGMVYDQLYSATALKKSQAERHALISDLDAQLRPWLERWREVQSRISVDVVMSAIETAYYSEYFDLFFGPTDIIYYSVQTTLHRAASMGEGVHTTEITAACFEAAAMGLHCHLKFLPIFKKKIGSNNMDAYVSWVLLYTSFTPLIVVFLHSVASNDPSDVKLLHDFLDSIEPIAHVSKDSARLFEVTKVFCRVAKALVDSRNHNPLGTYSHQSNTLLLPQDHNIVNISEGRGAEQLPDIFMQDFEGGGWTEGDVEAMSTFFGNWMGSSGPIVDMLNLDFSSCF
ncbi:uncharacterized protein DFL_001561 [Arthrobotrys flagrans]|uniref:Zn(2)-C6 fungal-type domain-containing protein n=1 Tax=Arthrobotrys flagrans TaxID=97331 RepID=A0A437A7Z1_ARTFL|nr:hypothetical protein DFL_001561 [Arthrobotrys flagrans]